MDDYEVYMNLVTIYGHSDKRYATRIVVAKYGSSSFYDVPSLSLGFIICLQYALVLVIFLPMSYKDIPGLSI